jgi:hypothetical protein
MTRAHYYAFFSNNHLILLVVSPFSFCIYSAATIAIREFNFLQGGKVVRDYGI